MGVPLYRFAFSIRRIFHQRIIRPAKHRLIYVISNKYAAHALVVLIAILVGYVNMFARDVRAETFGQESMLYALVVQDDSEVVEVVEAGSVMVNLGTRSSYFSDTVVDARLHYDEDYLSESFVTPLAGEGIPSTTRQVSTRDSVETYVIQEGDTLGQIAERFGLSLSTILWSNGLSFTSTIQPGDELKILPADGVLYAVRSGDTLSSIARTYGVEVDVILEKNNLSSADKLTIGDELLLPGGEPPTPVSTARSSSSVAELFTRPSTSVYTGGGWIWPTDWHVITQYYGWKHTGLDVDGDYSCNNYASRAGVVIYSGWRSGYGLTVEIDHGDGFVTRYAHHAQNYVSVGETVYAGQAVAQLGTTGRSTGTHLHFEIIKNGRFQNPLDYLQ